MAMCLAKWSVEGIRDEARSAEKNAGTDAEREALRALVSQCESALRQVRPGEGYPGGKLDSIVAQPVEAAAGALRKKFPGLLSDVD